MILSVVNRFVYNPIFIKIVQEQLWVQQYLSSLKPHSKYQKRAPEFRDFECLQNQSAQQLERINTINDLITKNIESLRLIDDWNDFYITYQCQVALYQLVIRAGGILFDADNALQELPDLDENVRPDDKRSAALAFLQDESRRDLATPKRVKETPILEQKPPAAAASASTEIKSCMKKSSLKPDKRRVHFFGAKDNANDGELPISRKIASNRAKKTRTTRTKPAAYTP